MARTYWNGVVVMVAALGLGGGMSWFLFAQTPDAPPDRYVTIEVSNEKVRCKILTSWSLPDGGRAYQVKSVESGDMITVVRQNASAGEKDAFVRIYKWRDASTPPVGAPEPPASVAGAQNNAAPTTTADKRPTKAKATPPLALNESKQNQSPYATIIHKTAPQAAANTPKETIVTVPDKSDAEAARSNGLALSKPPLLAPRKESGFDNSVDQLGQAPWAKEDAAAELPGKITVEGASEKNGVQLAAAELKPEPPARPNLEPMFALPSALKVEPKSGPKQVTPPAPKQEAKSEAKFAPKAQPSVVPPPLPLPPLPASELPPPQSLPTLAESSILTPPPLPTAEAKAETPPPALTPTASTPPALPPMPEIAPPAPPKLETAPPSPGAPPALAVDREAIMVPLYERARGNIYDRLLGPAARSHAAPAAAASNATAPPPINLREIASKSADASASGDLRPQTTIVLGPTVIVQSSAAKSTMPEAPVHVERASESFGDGAPVVSKMTNFDFRQMPPANVVAAPTEPIVPLREAPSIPDDAPGLVASSMPPPLPTTMPVVGKEVVHPAANHDIADANPPLVAPPAEFAQNRSGPASKINVPETGMPRLPRDGSVNRTRTTITPGQAAALNSAPPTIVTQAASVDAVSPTVVADYNSVVTKKGNDASPPSSIVGLLSDAHSNRSAVPQRALTGSQLGGGSISAVKQVNTLNPEMNSSRETIVTLNEGTSPYEKPVVIKKANANTPRATSIVGLMSGFRGQRTAATASSVAAPEPAPQFPVVVIGDRNRRPNGPGPMTVVGPAAPATFPSETIIEVTDGQYASANAAPVVEKRSTTDINRSTTIVGLMGVNQMAVPHSTYAYGSPYAASGAAGHSFDRTRTTISADQVAKMFPTGQPSVAMEPIIIANDAPPVVQKRKTALFDRSTKIAGMVGGNRATATDVTRSESGTFTSPTATPPRTTIASSGARAPGFMPPVGGQGKAPATEEVWPPQQIAMTNPIQQASHNATAGTVPANAAMDRPVTAAALNSGDQAALTKLMQSAKDSPQPSQRELAIIALSSYDGRSLPQLVSFLNQLAINDPAPAVRASAVNALTRMNVAPESVVHTLETLRGDADTRVRQAVAEATSAFGLGNQ